MNSHIAGALLTKQNQSRKHFYDLQIFKTQSVSFRNRRKAQTDHSEKYPFFSKIYTIQLINN